MFTSSSASSGRVERVFFKLSSWICSFFFCSLDGKVTVNARDNSKREDGRALEVASTMKNIEKPVPRIHTSSYLLSFQQFSTQVKIFPRINKLLTEGRTGCL